MVSNSSPPAIRNPSMLILNLRPGKYGHRQDTGHRKSRGARNTLALRLHVFSEIKKQGHSPDRADNGNQACEHP